MLRDQRLVGFFTRCNSGPECQKLAKKRVFLIECSSSSRSQFLIADRAFARTIIFSVRRIARMVGKRAKILSLDHVEDLLVFAAQTRHPIRNQVLVLLSVKAGLRAGEIANLTWQMVIDPIGEIGYFARTARPSREEGQRSSDSRSIPELHAALVKLAQPEPQTRWSGHPVRTRRPDDSGQYRLLVC